MGRLVKVELKREEIFTNIPYSEAEANDINTLFQVELRNSSKQPDQG